VNQAAFLDLLQQTLWMIVLLSAPVLGVSMVVGIAISVFQAVTQIQESTLTFVPKIVISLAVLVVVAPWMLDLLMEHTQKMFALLIRLGHPA
jgi:flagellar biosynthetic protein FliQ